MPIRFDFVVVFNWVVALFVLERHAIVEGTTDRAVVCDWVLVSWTVGVAKVRGNCNC